MLQERFPGRFDRALNDDPSRSGHKGKMTVVRLFSKPSENCLHVGSTPVGAIGIHEGGACVAGAVGCGYDTEPAQPLFKLRAGAAGRAGLGGCRTPKGCRHGCPVGAGHLSEGGIGSYAPVPVGCEAATGG